MNNLDKNTEEVTEETVQDTFNPKEFLIFLVGISVIIILSCIYIRDYAVPDYLEYKHNKALAEYYANKDADDDESYLDAYKVYETPAYVNEFAYNNYMYVFKDTYGCATKNDIDVLAEFEAGEAVFAKTLYDDGWCLCTSDKLDKTFYMKTDSLTKYSMEKRDDTVTINGVNFFLKDVDSPVSNYDTELQINTVLKVKNSNVIQTSLIFPKKVMKKVIRGNKTYKLQEVSKDQVIENLSFDKADLYILQPTNEFVETVTVFSYKEV